MTKEELIDHLQHLEKYTHYSEDAPALREAIEMLKCSEIPNGSEERTQERTETHACDLISRSEAIEALAKFVPYAICDESTESYTNGLTDAYNLILQLPPAQPKTEEQTAKSAQNVPNDDLISRKAAIDATWFDPSYTDPLNVLTEVRDKIKALPPAQPDLSEYSDKLWRNAYERGKREAQQNIVRCKDCRHDNHCAIQDTARTGGAFFCGAAERREE